MYQRCRCCRLSFQPRPVAYTSLGVDAFSGQDPARSAPQSWHRQQSANRRPMAATAGPDSTIRSRVSGRSTKTVCERTDAAPMLWPDHDARWPAGNVPWWRYRPGCRIAGVLTSEMSLTPPACACRPSGHVLGGQRVAHTKPAWPTRARHGRKRGRAVFSGPALRENTTAARIGGPAPDVIYDHAHDRRRRRRLFGSGLVVSGA